MNAAAGAAPGPRTITASAFAGDDGRADAHLRQALADWHAARAAGPADDAAARRRVHEALVGARLLVPVVAVEAAEAGEADGDHPDGAGHRHGGHDPRAWPAPGGPSGEKRTDMRLVAVPGPGGELGLPVFTGVDSLAAWDPAARPVPVRARLAFAAALAEGADAVVVDPGPPPVRPFVLTGAALRALAAGRVPLPPAEDPEVLGALRAAVGGCTPLRLAGAGPGRGGGLVAVLAPADGVSAAEAADAATALGRVLAADEVLRDRLSRPLELALLSAAGGRR